MRPVVVLTVPKGTPRRRIFWSLASEKIYGRQHQVRCSLMFNVVTCREDCGRKNTVVIYSSAMERFVRLAPGMTLQRLRCKFKVQGQAPERSESVLRLGSVEYVHFYKRSKTLFSAWCARVYPCCFAAWWGPRVWRYGWETVRCGGKECVRSWWLRRKQLRCNLERNTNMSTLTHFHTNSIYIIASFLL